MTMNKDQTYSGLRQEMTQTFYAFRQLITAEYVSYAFVLVALLQAQVLQTAMLFDVLLAALVFIVTLLGRSWFLQATRQGSYLLIAFELPDRVHNTGEDHAAYWILANRSFARHLRTNRRDTFHFPTRELHHFLVQQLVLGIVAGIVAGLTAFASVRQFNLAFSLRDATTYAIFAPPLITIVYVVLQIMRSRTANDAITRAWAEYYSDRKSLDDAYLRDVGINLDGKGLSSPAGEQQQTGSVPAPPAP